MKKLILIGSGGHARTVIDIALRLDYTIHGIIDLNFKKTDEKILGINVVGGLDYLTKIDSTQFVFHLAIGDNLLRFNTYNNLKNKDLSFVTLIHDSSVISNSVSIEAGCLIAAGVIINPMVKIGMNTIVNTKAMVDHESEIGKFAHIGPNSALAGRVKIGDQSFIGIGSNISDKICIGKSCIIGAGSTITKNVPDNSKVVGVNRIIQ